MPIVDLNSIKIYQLIKQWNNIIDNVKYNPTYREITLKAWQRCKEENISSKFAKLHCLSEKELQIIRNKNEELINAAKPFMEDISLSLLNIPHIIFLTDKDAWSIEISGNLTGEGIGLGINYSENYVGNSTIETVLKEGRPLLIYGVEHYVEGYRYLCCFGLPIRDKDGKIIAALNLSVPIEYADPKNLMIVLTAIKGLEEKLKNIENKNKLLDDKSIGKRIRKIREQRSLTQSKLASKADISQSFLSDIENGRKSPTLRSIGLIAKAFDLPIKNLIDY
ncbi:helix-turn-helix protein [Orenia metallireducens]|uniref:Helix-turn-helix n=1 Tax=Orenia metallireducens TaxID=1413210 RepID=A0A285FXX6_9FIRM|nr:helix-turn-helix domain-containing protein [Orenia metallireducens]PRX35566.1 helix-turn-helix protein [Orenia metallireducens]SNY16008.1 Helix-turn-helix [Orenia metallireducens]